MENDFELLITKLSKTPLSNDILDKIKFYLEKQTNDQLSSFITSSLQSLINFESWVWNLFSQDSDEWKYQVNYIELIDQLASFNFMLIFHKNHIEDNIKISLIIPENIDLINKIFQKIENIQNNDDNENDPYLKILSRWFDNLSYFIHEHSQYELSPIFIHICQHIGQNYILSDQYKFYLNQLCQTQIPQSVFTFKQLFYIKTCSFLFRMYICSKVDRSPFQGDQLLEDYGNDFIQIILVHNHTVNSWSNELLTCITHLMDLICALCWWGSDKAVYIDKLVFSEQLFYDYTQGLIHILSYKPFHECITSQWSNDETILIDSTCIFLIGALLAMKNLSSFIRSETILSNIILEIAQKSSYDRISICAYGILAEILSDEQLQEVKIADNISDFFFHILELAWNQPTQSYKRLPIAQLLTGFLTLSKNDAIQEKTVRTNKLPLLIEMSDKYPITLNILWSLSFNHEIQEQLRLNRTFMNKLTRLKEECHNDSKMRKIIFGILWNLELNRLDRTISETHMFDMMISYSHKDEIICKQIYEELTKAGYHVWIDFDQIHGNVMDAMAQAIEQSHTIVICMSEQYRRSNYCRAEAHYAFQRQRRIVPILLQEHYQPDGWLLFLIGQLLYVDFTKYEFPRAMEKLIEELKAPVIQQSQLVSEQSDQDSNFIVQPTLLPDNILAWTHIHVQNWLIGHNLTQMARLLTDFDGASLNSLAELIGECNSQQLINLFQEDCLRRINEDISLLELARFRILLNDKKQLLNKTSNKFNYLSYCQIM